MPYRDAISGFQPGSASRKSRPESSALTGRTSPCSHTGPSRCWSPWWSTMLSSPTPGRAGLPGRTRRRTASLPMTAGTPSGATGQAQGLDPVGVVAQSGYPMIPKVATSIAARVVPSHATRADPLAILRAFCRRMILPAFSRLDNFVSRYTMEISFYDVNTRWTSYRLARYKERLPDMDAAWPRPRRVPNGNPRPRPPTRRLPRSRRWATGLVTGEARTPVIGSGSVPPDRSSILSPTRSSHRRHGRPPRLARDHLVGASRLPLNLFLAVHPRHSERPPSGPLPDEGPLRQPSPPAYRSELSSARRRTCCSVALGLCAATAPRTRAWSVRSASSTSVLAWRVVVAPGPAMPRQLVVRGRTRVPGWRSAPEPSGPAGPLSDWPPPEPRGLRSDAARRPADPPLRVFQTSAQDVGWAGVVVHRPVACGGRGPTLGVLAPRLERRTEQR